MSNIIKEIDRMSGAEVPSHTITDALKKLGAGPSKNITDALSRVEVGGGTVSGIMQIQSFESGVNKQISITEPYIDAFRDPAATIFAKYDYKDSPDTGEYPLLITDLEAVKTYGSYDSHSRVSIESGALADSLHDIISKYLTLERAQVVTSNPNQGTMFIPITDPINWGAVTDLFMDTDIES